MFMSEFGLDICCILARFFDRIEPRECLRRLSFENIADGTSQRIKRTSGARVVFFVFSKLDLFFIDV